MRQALTASLILLLTGCAATHTSRMAAIASTPRSTAELLVSGATAMLGQPYRWGGAAPGGFDCSGLVMYAATGAGLSLPRTAHEQLNAGSPIARREVRGGDLVFMRLGWKELHVGIALDPDHFVHAPSSGGRVRIDSLDKAPYAHGFWKARRVASDGLN